MGYILPPEDKDIDIFLITHCQSVKFILHKAEKTLASFASKICFPFQYIKKKSFLYFQSCKCKELFSPMSLLRNSGSLGVNSHPQEITSERPTSTVSNQKRQDLEQGSVNLLCKSPGNIFQTLQTVWSLSELLNSASKE